MMRFFSRARSLLLAIGVALLVPCMAWAAPQEVTVSQGYSNILSQGLIFANICTSPAPKDGTGDTCQCRAQGICSLAEVTQVAVNIIILILGISGSVALLMFVYGGWNWIFAQGRPEYVQTGKDTMKHAIIGLAIIFGAYAIINFVIAILGGISPQSTIEGTIENLPTTKNGSSSQIDAGSVLQSN